MYMNSYSTPEHVTHHSQWHTHNIITVIFKCLALKALSALQKNNFKGEGSQVTKIATQMFLSDCAYINT